MSRINSEDRKNKELADRAHPAAKPALRRPLRDRTGAGWLTGRLSSARRLRRRIQRLGRTLFVTLEHHRLERSAALEILCPADTSRSRFSHPEGPTHLRPIWHRREDRAQVHVLVCFLAFVLWKSLEMWQQRADLGNSPRTILEELARIQSQHVVLPDATHGQIRLGCVTQSDIAEAALLDRLCIVLPKRMHLAERELPAPARSA